MAGLFRTGDILHVRETPFSSLKSGDVVVFRRPHKQPDCRIVHRIKFMEKDGTLVTQGDAVLTPDRCRVKPDHFIGVVKGYSRGNIRRRIFNGHAGRLHAMRTRLLIQASNAFKSVSTPLYLHIRRTAVRYCSWKIPVRKIKVVTPGGFALKYVYGSKTIARWDSCSDCWTCRKPYDLFLRKPGG